MDMGIRYIVTGAAGHLGSTVIRLLQNTDSEVYGLLLPEEKPVIKAPNIHYVHGDVCRKETLSPLFENADGKTVKVIHTAGIISIEREVSPLVYEVNVNGTKNMIHICREKEVDRFVYVSSVHAIPEMAYRETIHEAGFFSAASVVGGYAKTKAEATQSVLDASRKGLQAVIVHPSGIIGPYDKGNNHLVQLVIEYMNGKLPVCVKGGYDFVDVRDVAAGCLFAAEKGKQGQCYILSGHYLSIQDMLSCAGKYCNKKKLPAIPVFLAEFAAPWIESFSRICGKRALYTRYSLHTLTSNSNFSSSKARTELGYFSRPADDTIRDMTGWIMEN